MVPHLATVCSDRTQTGLPWSILLVGSTESKELILEFFNYFIIGLWLLPRRTAYGQRRTVNSERRTANGEPAGGSAAALLEPAGELHMVSTIV